MAREDNKKMKFFREDLTQRRGGTENAEKEKEEGLKKPLNQKLSYPEARRYNDELANNDSASLRLCVSLLSILFLVLISCQTIPNMSGNFLEDANFLPLDSGASVYIVADAKKARPVINLLPIQELSDRQVVQILDETEVLAVALFPQESGRRYQIAAWGNYPSFRANLALGSNSGWKKNRSAAGGDYWHSQTNRLSLAMSSKQVRAVVSANSEPVDPITPAPGMEIPDGFNEFRRGSIFSCWLESPDFSISRIMNDLGLPFNSPVKKLFISLVQTQEEKYETIIRLQFENASFARAMTVILNAAYNRLRGSTLSLITSIFFTNPPVQNGNNVDITAAVLSVDRIVQLLDLFSLF